MKNRILFCLAAILPLFSCTQYAVETGPDGPGQPLAASISDGLYGSWNSGDEIALIHNGRIVIAETLESGRESGLSAAVNGTFTEDNPLYAVFPADCMADAGAEGVAITVPGIQTDGGAGFDPEAAATAARTVSGPLDFHTVCGGIRLNFQMSGVTKVELESVDGYTLSGTVRLRWDEQGIPVAGETSGTSYIIVFNAQDNSGFVPGEDYYISTLPCDLYGGYRLSIYKDGLVAHYFGVHQTVERASYIVPADLVESELVFDDPDAPLVEEGRPELDATTTALLRQYQQNPTKYRVLIVKIKA